MGASQNAKKQHLNENEKGLSESIQKSELHTEERGQREGVAGKKNLSGGRKQEWVSECSFFKRIWKIMGSLHERQKACL